MPNGRDGSFTTDAFSTRANQCPLLVQSRHYCSAQRSDAKGQKRPSSALLDDVVSAGDDCLRECEADRFGSLKVDDQLELRR